MHLCFEVDDMDPAMKRLKEVGVEPEGAQIVFQEQDGLKAGFGTAVAYFRDQVGTNLEIIAPRFKRKNS
ncbi:VOC family protein [Sphingobacterium sp. CZ-2]|uniref:VOC family protein n=1 Tax=Sphingobacterium sp. CZ-2 TaxID=2557994 RepID=UPI001FD6BF4B|nr:hypothetical protein [Sphingobacterium sp. CZ-2]